MVLFILFFMPDNTFYFIPSSEFCAYLKQISHTVCSEKISYIFTSDEYDLYFFTVANRGCFDNLGLNFFKNRSGMHRSCLTLRFEVRTSNKVNDVTLLRHF